MDTDPIAAIRRFNRAVTTEIGALNDSWLGKGRPLAVARVLSVIGPDGIELADLRTRLSLDSGFLSRTLRTLEDEGLIAVVADPADRRRRRAAPTSEGRREIADYERLSQTHAAQILARLPHRAELIAAMEQIALAFSRDRITIDPADPESDEARTCLAAYYAELSRRFGVHFDPAASGDPEADALRPPRGAFLIAHCDGLAVACGALKGDGTATGEVKRVWVRDTARGLGLATRIMDALESRARALGMDRLQLDTNATLTEALALYRRLGWAEVPAYNANPYAQHWFEKRLTPVAEPSPDR